METCNGPGFAWHDGISCARELTDTGTARKNLYKVRPGKIPALRGEGGHEISPLARCTGSCWLLEERRLCSPGGYPSSRSLCACAHILATLSELSGFQTEHRKLGGKSDKRLVRMKEEGIRGKFDQSILYACLKFLSNKKATSIYIYRSLTS